MRARPQATVAAVGCALALGGCASIGSLAGAVTGAASGGGSVNPAVGYAVGITTKAATDALVQYISRKRHRGEQDQIADTAGDLPVGRSAPWRIRHRIPLFDDEQGTLTVVREMPNVLSPCREVVFSVDSAGASPHPKGYYIATVCRHGAVWKWALAEPSTVRWGFLE